MTDEKKNWDQAAKDYQKVFSLGSNDYNDTLLRFWQEEGMIRPGCRVLDIGCGVGKYGTYLAELGCDVTLTDLSGEMLRHAAANMSKYSTPWVLYETDFNTATGREPAFADGFDLVISTMSPAIHDVETLQKMSAMSHGWCFLARFRTWEQPMRDKLIRKMNAAPKSRMEHLDEDVTSMIRAVSTAGFVPRVKYVPYNWSDTRTPEEMADVLLRHCFEESEREILYDRALSAAELAGENGFLNDAVNTTVAWIYWKTSRDG